jgi:hypothetical protein
MMLAIVSIGSFVASNQFNKNLYTIISYKLKKLLVASFIAFLLVAFGVGIISL